MPRYLSLAHCPLESLTGLDGLFLLVLLCPELRVNTKGAVSDSELVTVTFLSEPFMLGLGVDTPMLSVWETLPTSY